MIRELGPGASITLDGQGEFVALGAGLRRNAGRISLRSQRDLLFPAPGGVFTNAGLIDLGPGSDLHIGGRFSQTADGSLTIALDQVPPAGRRLSCSSDATLAGQELRLRQEFFFTSASLQDIVRRHVAQHDDLSSLSDYASIQLNDTHPAIAVAELMRILVDDHEVSWAEAWRITTHTLSYTNHTLLPEALETWPVELMNRLLPRHMQIIYLINWLHLKELPDSVKADPTLATPAMPKTNGPIPRQACRVEE